MIFLRVRSLKYWAAAWVREVLFEVITRAVIQKNQLKHDEAAPPKEPGLAVVSDQSWQKGEPRTEAEGSVVGEMEEVLKAQSEVLENLQEQMVTVAENVCRRFATAGKRGMK